MQAGGALAGRAARPASPGSKAARATPTPRAAPAARSIHGYDPATGQGHRPLHQRRADLSRHATSRSPTSRSSGRATSSTSSSRPTSSRSIGAPACRTTTSIRSPTGRSSSPPPAPAPASSRPTARCSASSAAATCTSRTSPTHAERRLTSDATRAGVQRALRLGLRGGVRPGAGVELVARLAAHRLLADQRIEGAGDPVLRLLRAASGLGPDPHSAAGRLQSARARRRGRREERQARLARSRRERASSTSRASTGPAAPTRWR